MVGRGRGGERRKRGGRPSSSKAGARSDISASFLVPTNDSHLDDARQNHGFTKTSFSLSEEARNTERPHLWNSDLKLRNSRIAFVSAGTSSADELNPVSKKAEANEEVTDSSLEGRSAASVKASDHLPYTMTPHAQMSNMTLNDPQCVSARRCTLEGGLDVMSKKSNKDPGLEWSEASNEASFNHHEYTNCSPDTDLVTPMMRRSLSSTGSDSSGEVVIFAGRRKLCNRGDRTHTSDAQSKNRNPKYVSNPSRSRDSLATIVDHPTKATAQTIENNSEHRPSSFSPPDWVRPPDCHNSNSTLTIVKPKRRRRKNQTRKETKDEGDLNDYIANLHESGTLDALFESSMLNQRNIGGFDTAEGQDKVASLKSGHAERRSITDSKAWDSAEECFNELRLWNEGLESIELVLSKRQRPSGVQYLVVGVGCSVDDARWFPASSLKSQSAEFLIQEFENNAESNHHLDVSGVSDASLTGSEQTAQELQERLNVDDGEDERDLEERRKARLTDEQVARLLSKQDELGLGSDNLILYDGGDVWTDNRDEHQVDGLWERASTHRANLRSERMKRSRSNRFSATALADIFDNDPYDSFDVMDQERPSLHKRPKGRRGKLSLDLSDSELEHSLHSTWEKDRTTKKMRKQEREELRMQGLLGKKPQADLKLKYSEGISITQVKKEIKRFLLSSMESLSLPPMAQGERKIVHEIANVFKLKSKSIGGGRSRYPVLYKTSRTVQYSDETFKAAESVLFSGRFLPHMDRVRKGALAGMGRRGGAASTSVSYRDGEVVGAAAPEIGQENRGRTMLERMGWSTGTALGASNNSRGLVQPVAQVVKTSRSGLG